MAVEDFMNPEFDVEGSDDNDDELLVFSRNSSSSLVKQLSIKPPSVNGTSNGQYLSTIKGKAIKSLEPFIKPPSSSRQVKKEIPIDYSEDFDDDDDDDDDDDKPLSERQVVGLQKGNVKPSTSDSKDSDDDKPLSCRLDKGKAQILKANVQPQDDSDDEKPLSSRYQMKSDVGTSSSKYDDSDDEKPLASRLQNGSSSKSKIQNKVPLNSAKRPLGQAKSSVKKAKLSDASTSAHAKQIPQKMRNKAASSSGSKSALAKRKIAKAKSSKLKNVNKKSKKIVKISKYCRSSKELPNSGDVQKWTTLVHNGVIFPPPYQPHGVKMLYDGEPVNLTPEQEEVATLYALMLESDYVKKDIFNENFFNDWKKLLGRNHVIQELTKCDFRPIEKWHLREKEKKKAMSKDEKTALREEKAKL